MNIVRWSPFSGRFGLDNPFVTEADHSFVPPVDVVETGDNLIVKLEVPGVGAGDIDVRVEDGTLIIEGENKQEQDTKDVTVYRRERTYGRFSRRFTLPEGLDTTKIGASHRNGILEVTLPRAEQAKPRKIEIQAA